MPHEALAAPDTPVQTKELTDSLRLQPSVDLERRWLFMEVSTRSAIPGLIMLSSLGWYLSPYIGPEEAWLWSGFMMFNFMLRLVVLRWAMRQSPAIANEPWLGWFVCGTALVMGLGSMYGSLHWFPLLEDPQKAMITLVNVGWVAGGMAAQGCYPRWTPYWVVPILLGNVIGWTVSGGSHSLLVAGLTAMVSALMAGGQLTSARSIKESLTAKLLNRELAAELMAQKSLVENAARAKTAFLIAASHDLRQPAMGLGLLISAIQGAQDLPGAKRIALSAERALGAMERILQSLMEFSRLDSGQVTVRRSPFNLRTVINNMVEEIGATLQPGVTTKVDAPSVMIVTDQSLFEQVLRNLLSNAARFTHEGEILVKVELATDEIDVTVADTGIGIPEHALSSIFKEYFQVHNDQGRRAKGLGLGLSIVDKAAKLLDARIDVRSRPGEGSSFSIRIPVGILGSPTTLSPRTASVEDPRQGSGRLGGHTILVVDDDVLVRESLQTVLETFGARVLASPDPDRAMQLLGRDAACIKLALVDYQISEDYSGIELIEAIRGQWPHIGCVLVTGDVRKEVSERARAASLPVLYKPLRVEKLIEIIEK